MKKTEIEVVWVDTRTGRKTSNRHTVQHILPPIGENHALFIEDTQGKEWSYPDGGPNSYSYYVVATREEQEEWEKGDRIEGSDA